MSLPVISPLTVWRPEIVRIYAILGYMNPSSKQTLREGILELRAAEGADGDAVENVADDLTGAIEVHDAIHVLFACPTDLAGEVSAHVWTIFGTTMTVHQMHSVNRHNDHKTVLRQIGHVKLLKKWLNSIPAILGLINRSRKMTKKWPAHEFESYLDIPLIQTRSDFNILLPGSNGNVNSSGGAALRHIRARTQ